MKKIILAAAIAALASMSVVAFASAGVQRNQPTGTLTVTLPGIQGNVHTYTLATACDGLVHRHRLGKSDGWFTEREDHRDARRRPSEVHGHLRQLRPGLLVVV